MSIEVGAKIPEATLTFMGDDGPSQMTTGDLFGGKKVVMFAVPGAFTPTCNNNHLPGYVKHADAIKAKGVDEIAVVSVNDVFVMSQWAEASAGKGAIHFFADGAAAFTKSLGMELDLSDFGLGLRSKRYSMVVEDGTITALHVEDNPGEAVTSGAEKLMEVL